MLNWLRSSRSKDKWREQCIPFIYTLTFLSGCVCVFFYKCGWKWNHLTFNKGQILKIIHLHYLILGGKMGFEMHCMLTLEDWDFLFFILSNLTTFFLFPLYYLRSLGANLECQNIDIYTHSLNDHWLRM